MKGGREIAAFNAGRYQVHRLLGEGSRKRVYLARDTRLDRDVALALIKTDGLDTAGVSRAVREAQVMGRLGDHPNIVTVYDVGEEGGRPFIISQFMAGGSLEEALRGEEAAVDAEDQSVRRPSLDLEQRLRIADHVCRALEHAHAQGVIHRDLKPANVWLAHDGTAKLGDFGLALSRDRSRLTVEGLMVGTVAYMAPEQVIGKSVDARADLYALGALLYELTTRRPPFMGNDAVAVISQHLHTAPVAPSWHAPSTPPELEALILGLLEKDPDRRPQSAAAVREVLERLHGEKAGLESRARIDVGAPTPSERQPPNPAANPLGRLDAGVFVGRENEMTSLRAAAEEAIAGGGRVVLVGGEPGIGKTRIAQEIATYGQLRGMQVLWGRCHEGGGSPAYWPWVQAIRAYVYERAPQDLRAELGSGAPEIANVVSAVRERLPDIPPPSNLEPEQERFRLFDSFTSFLRTAAARRALLLIVDDLHWADAPSLLLLMFLAREIQNARLMVVATYRDEEAQAGRPLFGALAELARADVCRRMTLAGLPEAEIAQLIARCAGETPSAALIKTVARQTDGNPFFVGEVVRWLVAQGQLRHGASGTLGVPPSVREVIGRRLERLSPRCKEILLTASVIGRDFSSALLARIRGEAPEALLESIEEAVSARAVVEVGGEAGRYSFLHALIRETLYRELSGARRCSLHQQIGEAIETLHAARLDSHLPALAHHFAQAMSPDTAEKAVVYAQRAGDRATKQAAYEDAVVYYRQVLDGLERSGEADTRRHAEVLLALGRAEFGSGKVLDEARQRYVEAAAIARRLDARELLAQAALAFHTGSSVAGVVDRTRTHLLQEANDALAGERTILRAKVLAQLAFALAELAEPPEVIASVSAEAVAIARERGDPDTLVEVLGNVARAHWRPGDLPARLSWIEEMETLSGQVANRHLIPRLHLVAIGAFSLSGDHASLQRSIAAYISASEEVRFPWYIQAAHHLRATQATISGRFAEAETHAQAAYAIVGAMQNEHALQVFGSQLCKLRAEQGRITEVQSVLADAVDRQPGAVMWRAALAAAECELGHVDSARAHLARIDLSTVPAEPSFWLGTVGVLAEAAAGAGDQPLARALYDLLSPYAHLCLVSADAVVHFGAAARHLGVLASTLRRWDDATGHFEQALKTNEQLRSPPLVARTQFNYASMLLARDAPGDRTKAAALVNAAIDTTRRLGMALLLEQSLALKLAVQGAEGADPHTSIDSVAIAVDVERPDLRAHRAPDGTVTILFSDIEGFTALTHRLGDRRALSLLQDHNRIIRAQIDRYQGFEVKSQGDGFMVAFSSARRALFCAVAVQRALTGYAAEHPEEPIRVRIGLHTGEAIKEGEDFFGTTVNLAARIAGQACGGEILVSSVLKELTDTSGDFRFGAGRPLQLKGLAGVRTVFPVPWAGEATTSPPPASGVLRREDAFWTIIFDGTTSRLKDVKGIRYLAQLLRYPGREFHALDLIQVVDSVGAELETRGPRQASGLEILDPAAKAAYRRRLHELREDLQEAERFNDGGRAERARAEIESITEQLSAAVGLGGRDRIAASAAERARSTVTKRIKEALKRIAETNASLGDHFATRVKTGTFCVYVPDAVRPIEWELD